MQNLSPWLEAFLILHSISSSFHCNYCTFYQSDVPKIFLPLCQTSAIQVLQGSVPNFSHISVASCSHCSTNFKHSFFFFLKPKAQDRQVPTSATNTMSFPFPKLCSLALQILLYAISSQLSESSFLHRMPQASSLGKQITRNSRQAWLHNEF